jgi:predicted transglutaminase-like cysteine proteinase
MTATPEQLSQLEAVNDQINAIAYEALGVDVSEDQWIDTPKADEVWECRDYTIAKAKLLRQQGWPVEDLFVVLCNDELGEYHAVLGARAGGDVYVLDNRAPAVYLWSDPPYKYEWLHQQVAGSDEFRDASEGLA